MEENLEVTPLIELDLEKADMDGLLQTYTELDLEISKLIIAQEEFRKAHLDTFKEYEDFSKKMDLIREQQDALKGSLKQRMREENQKEVIGIRFTAKYTAPYTKKKFETDKFYADYAPDTAMYKRYVSTTNVSDSIKISENKAK